MLVIDDLNAGILRSERHLREAGIEMVLFGEHVIWARRWINLIRDSPELLYR